MSDDTVPQPDDAIRRISERLERNGIASRRLEIHELSSYRRDFVAGWRIAASFPDEVRRLDLLVGRDSPWKPPRVAIVDRPSFTTWPHVEKDGILCLLPSSAAVDPSRPDDVAMAILGSGAELIENVSSGMRNGDFKDEFCSYWDWHCDRGVNRIYTLLDPKPPSRSIHVWLGQGFTVVGESSESVKRWLRNRFPQIKERDLDTTSGVLIWLNEPPSPPSFPKRGTDLVALADANATSFIELARPIASAVPGQLVTILGANSSNGPGFLGVVVQHPDVRIFDSGFRQNKRPTDLTVKRFLQGRTLRTNAERADWSWIHGRDQDDRAALLRNKNVSVLGCGSIGSAVASMLASAGVGNLILIDPDQLSWANVGRHVLGAPAVGKNKAKSLSEHLTSHYPHIGRVDVHEDTWEGSLRNSADLFETSDLILSATGDWASEAHLSDWRLSTKPELSIVYGWTEGHACAGHAVAIRDQGCFQCGFDEVGNPRLRVTTWPHGVTMKQEPACGAVYQPYGPIELTYIASLISELAIDCLLGVVKSSTHRIWAGSSRLLTGAGGTWSPEWIAIANHRQQGSFVEERDWLQASNCGRCFPEAA